MTIHIVIPGLLGPVADLPDAAELPRLPLIERLLTRAVKESSARGYSAMLAQLFALQSLKTADAPTAAISYFADTGKKSDRYLLQADPIHLYPDMDRLLVFDTTNMELSQADADAFVSAFNHHFAEDGYQLEASHPKRWYLIIDPDKPDPQLTTSGLDQVIGRNMQHFVPQGEDAQAWIQLLNEIQMLFYGLAVNDVRADKGLPSINGIWLSGGGRLPIATRSRLQFSQCYGDCILLKGLAELSAVASEQAVPVEVQENSLLVIKDLHRSLLDADVSAWLGQLEVFERRLERLTKLGADLVLYPCNGQSYQYRPVHKLQFWRLKKSFWRQLEAE